MSEINAIIDPKDAKVSVKELKISGHLQRGEISPFDIPRQIKARYDETEQVFSCELLYPTIESHKRERVGGFNGSEIYFSYGKNSGKLYAIEICNIEKKNIPKITIQIELNIDKQIESQKRDHDGTDHLTTMLNLLSAKKALEKSEIFNSFQIA